MVVRQVGEGLQLVPSVSLAAMGSGLGDADNKVDPLVVVGRSDPFADFRGSGSICGGPSQRHEWQKPLFSTLSPGEPVTSANQLGDSQYD